ncbi:MAG TPA: MFS transporter [Legionellales bacterium]|nr:MFS transporter [Legionellales bacterium]
MKSHFRWVVVFLLFIISMTNFIDRASISFAISDIAKEFNFSNLEKGYILSAFGIGYLLTILFGGILADRLGAHKVLTVACILWILATLSIGFAQSFIMLFLSRGFLGLAEGPNFPCVTKVIKDWLPLSERNLALSLSVVAVPLSLALSGPIVTSLMLGFNWRGMYFILAGLSLVFIFLWWFLFRDNPADSKQVLKEELSLITADIHDSERAPSDLNIMDILKNETLIANNWGYFVYGFYLFFFMTWMPSYIKSKFDYSLSEIGWLTMIPWIFASILMVFAGWLSDYIYRKNKCFRLSRTYPLMFSQLIGGLSLIPLVFCQQIEWFILCVSLSVGAVISVNPIYYSVNIDTAGNRAATSYGLMGLLLSLSGIIAPILAGWVVNLTGEFNAVLMIMFGLSLSSILIFWLFHNKNKMVM